MKIDTNEVSEDSIEGWVLKMRHEEMKENSFKIRRWTGRKRIIKVTKNANLKYQQKLEE